MKALTFGSLFAGFGGLDLGLERAGLVCRWQVEISQPCQRILEKHFSGVPKFADVREVGKHNLDYVDVIAGGFPCQDVSASGKKVGVGNGARSGLWKEYYRIVCELQPRYVLVENVEGLRHKGRGIDIVLGDLAASGYDAIWDCIPAASIGAPHRRDRVFIVAYKAALANADGKRLDDDLRSQLFTAIPRVESGAWQAAKPLECLAYAGNTYPGIPRDLRIYDGVSGKVGRSQRSH